MMAPELQLIYLSATTGNMYEAIENGGVSSSLTTLLIGVLLTAIVTYAIIVISRLQISKIKKKSFVENR